MGAVDSTELIYDEGTTPIYDEHSYDLLKCFDIVDNPATNSPKSHNSHNSSSTAHCVSSKLLFSMNTSHLARIVKYILESEPSFAKYSYQSGTISNAFITHKIKGKMLYELTSYEFRDELPWIRNVISVQIYDYLNSLSDQQIHNILLKTYNNDNNKDIHIALPPYLKPIDLNSSENNIAFNRFDEHQFELFVYIVLNMYKYNETLTDKLMLALREKHLNGAKFTALKRTDFCRSLKAHDIKGAIASKLYKMIVLHCDNVPNYLQTHNIFLCSASNDAPFPYNKDVVQQLVSLGYGTSEECINASKMVLNPSDINDVLDSLQATRDKLQNDENEKFQKFVSNLFQCNEYDESVIDAILSALDNKVDIEKFTQFKRVDLARLLKPFGIKAGIASKAYKLISANIGDIDKYTNANNDICSASSSSKEAEDNMHLNAFDSFNNHKQTLHVLWNSGETNETDIAINDGQEIDFKRKSVDSAYSLQDNTSLDTDHTDIKQDSASSSSYADNNKYNETVIDQLVSLGCGTREECIKASQVTVNYWDINEVAESIKSCSKDSCTTPMTPFSVNMEYLKIPMLDSNEFVSFLYNVAQLQNLERKNIEQISAAITQLNMNGNMFMKLSRASFGRELKAYGIKAGFASKMYKLIMSIDSNDIASYLYPKYEKESDSDKDTAAAAAVMIEAQDDEDITYSAKTITITAAATEAATDVDNSDIVLSEIDIAEIAIVDFQRSTYKMLKNMNQCMKMNGVNGKILTGHYDSKQYLTQYLSDHVRAKSVNVLCDMICDDYMRNGEAKRHQIEQYDRKNLLKYFISLLMYQLKRTIIDHKLDETKCISLTRKTICCIIVNECGLSIGAATNIVNKIYEAIKPN